MDCDSSKLNRKTPPISCNPDQINNSQSFKITHVFYVNKPEWRLKFVEKTSKLNYRKTTWLLNSNIRTGQYDAKKYFKLKIINF